MIQFVAFFGFVVSVGATGALSAQNSPYVQGLLELKEHHLDKALNRFDEVTLESSEFVPSLLEAQRILYQKQEWEKFFGRAIFYRNRFLNSGSIEKQNFREELIALEAMALIRFCRWDDAAAVLKQGVKMSKSLGTSGEGWLDQAQSFLSAFKNYPDIKSTQRDVQNPSSVFNTTQYWAVSKDLLKHVSHPRNLRLNVKSLCTQPRGSNEK